MRSITLLALILSLAFSIQAQETINWFNPVESKYQSIEGQAWPRELISDYDRLPKRAKGSVADDVWGNSKHSAGMMVRFKTDASQIYIRYQVADRENYSFYHMPSTGKSGIDLYSIDSDGKELWCKGWSTFADTISYKFKDINPNDKYHKQGREYRLYLPLYNEVQWLEIGVNDYSIFTSLPAREEAPIVVYGTSIAHGACASRPGMAWTSILSRNMDRPLINLGFSGSGRLEEPVIELISEIEAKIFILDCLPNLPANSWKRSKIKDGAAVKNRILKSVKTLRAAHPTTPILLVDHAGYTEEYISDVRKSDFTIVNQIQKEAFQQLKVEGFQNLYYLTKEEIGLTMDDMVDGTHPTDLGMYHYASAYESKLRAIFNEEKGSISTTQPCTQAREPDKYDWAHRHNQILALNKKTPPKTVIFANSIIHFWGGAPKTDNAQETETWTNYLEPAGVRNLAYGWDRIENVLWRIHHGELDGYEVEHVILMIGTNNLHLNSDDEIIEGLDKLIDAIKIRQPKAEVSILGLLPRRKYESRIKGLNFHIAQLASEKLINYAEMGGDFLLESGSIDESLFSDGLHPNKPGYLLLRKRFINLCAAK